MALRPRSFARLGRSTILALAVAGGVAHGAPELLRDVDTTVVPADSNPRFLGTTARGVLFIASPAPGQLRLYASDGTAAGTSMITAQEAQQVFLPREVIAEAGRLLFLADDPGGRQALWASDGSSAGTVRLALVDAETVERLGTVAGGTLLRLRVAARPDELWVTDGTTGGTRRVTGLPGESLDAATSATVSGRVYFAQNTDADGLELWSSDGTVAGTRLETDVAPGATSSGVQVLAAIGQDVYLSAVPTGDQSALFRYATTSRTLVALTDGTRSVWPGVAIGGTYLFAVEGEAWRTNGTPAGTTPLVAPQAGEGLASSEFVAVGSRAFFAYSTASAGAELWTTDGTVAGTRLVLDAVPGPDGSSPQLHGAVGSRLLYAASSAATGFEPWISDGTAAGTRAIADSFPGAAGGSIVRGAALRDRLVFVLRPAQVAPDGSVALELWSTDAAGLDARRLRTEPAAVPPATDTFAATGERLLFGWGDPVLGRELGATDGTTVGTSLVRELAPQTRNLSSHPLFFSSLDGVALFSALSGPRDRELWRTDGTTAGTTQVADVRPGPEGSGAARLQTIDRAVYFWANDGTRGFELWRSDGTSTGTRLHAEFAAGAADASPGGCDRIVRLGDALHLAVRADAAGEELWRTDGTPSGTARITDVAPGGASSSPCPLGTLGSTLYFVAVAGGSVGLWATDGTTAGTRLVAAVPRGIGVRAPLAPLVFNGELVFTSGSSPLGAGLELWRSDGTASGTRVTLDATALGGGAIAWLRPLGGAVLFGVSGGTAPGVYRWPGGAAPAERVYRDVNLALGVPPVEWRGRVAFVGELANDGLELHATDGTLAGSAALTDLNPAGERRAIDTLVPIGAALHFRAVDSSDDPWFWRTNGTPGTTRRLGPIGRDPQALAGAAGVAAGQLVYGAWSEPLGNEPHVERNLAPAVVADSAATNAGQAVTIPLLANDGDADGQLVAATVRVVRTPADGTVAVDAQGSATYRPRDGFAGTDTFAYVVGDDGGRDSAVTPVTVAVAAPPAPPPVVPPPPVTPPSPPPATPPGGGGGGSLDLATLLALGSLALVARRRRGRVPPACQRPAAAR